MACFTLNFTFLIIKLCGRLAAKLNTDNEATETSPMDHSPPHQLPCSVHHNIPILSSSNSLHTTLISVNRTINFARDNHLELFGAEQRHLGGNNINDKGEGRH